MHKILIVDDEVEIVKILEKFLEKNGFEVTGTSSGEKALEILRSPAGPDLMVLDIKMPEISGVDILLEMKKINRNLPVVILSGSIGVEQNIEVLSELGYDRNKILYKPIDLNDLLEQIRQHLASC